MAGDNTKLLGVTILGAGVLLAISAYKNKRLFGATGLVTQAIQTGNIVGNDAPPLVGSVSTSDGGTSTEKIFPNDISKPYISDGPIGSGNHDVFTAVIDISGHNYALAEKVAADFVNSDCTSLKDDYILLEQAGLWGDVKVLQQHSGCGG